MVTSSSLRRVLLIGLVSALGVVVFLNRGSASQQKSQGLSQAVPNQVSRWDWLFAFLVTEPHSSLPQTGQSFRPTAKR
jgi:hypothetical protein